ncbi:30S ribosomal protein S8 [Candidatus Woesebacteria bacterium]|nr:30S ribosomal protein S8 [Candidatus Woesebacteria bacterium]MCD8507631.1 30S ribosomal protein S8 [Candidatus Woesebacteria bacterium]MCD8526783.1 30S ribosomal protein S8 [Candidatus Woesebacteria bacterium]MCD8546471.1 30S ribosomal protein S8 [Candidatus Woesebacteria bacterium]
MTDTVADLIIRIKNAYMAKHKTVVMPASKLRENIVKILVEGGYVSSYAREAQQPQDVLNIDLRYINGKPAVVDVKRVSKPGRRIYRSADQLPQVLGGYGTAVVSTSQGVMSDKEARQKKIGGEILFQVW